MKGFDKARGRRARSTAGPESFDKAVICRYRDPHNPAHVWCIAVSGVCPTKLPDTVLQTSIQPYIDHNREGSSLSSASYHTKHALLQLVKKQGIHRLH